MTNQQYEKEIKRLELSNKAFVKELSWHKSIIHRIISPILVFFGLFLYLLGIVSNDVGVALVHAILFTTLFVILEFTLNRLFKRFRQD